MSNRSAIGFMRGRRSSAALAAALALLAGALSVAGMAAAAEPETSETEDQPVPLPDDVMDSPDDDAQDLPEAGPVKASPKKASEEEGKKTKPEPQEKQKVAAAPQDTSQEPTGGEHRAVNGHYFIAPTFAFSAITNGSVSFVQGFGVLDVKSKPLPTGQKHDARILVYPTAFLAQIAILNRLSFDLTANGRAAVGGDLDTLLSAGAITNLTLGGMPKLRLFTVDAIGLQAAIGVGGYYDRSISIQPALTIKKGAGDQKPSEHAIIVRQESKRFVPALMIAEGVGPVGVQLSASPTLRFGDDHRRAVEAAGHLTLDFGRLTRYLPFAITGEYGISVDMADSYMERSMAAGLYYSGRRDVSIGAVGSMQQQKDATFMAGTVGIQYYF